MFQFSVLIFQTEVKLYFVLNQLFQRSIAHKYGIYVNTRSVPMLPRLQNMEENNLFN